MPEIKIVNTSTGKETVRDMTDKELQELEQAQADAKIQSEAERQAQAARLAKLEALGLSVDDLRALLG